MKVTETFLAKFDLNPYWLGAKSLSMLEIVALMTWLETTRKALTGRPEAGDMEIISTYTRYTVNHNSGNIPIK
jgi:hypothetical protein